MGKKKGKEPEVSEIGTIESTLQLEALELKKMRWVAKFNVEAILPRTYHRYRMVLEFDESPYLERIEDLEDSFNSGLFKNDPKMVKQHNKSVGELRENMEAQRNDCETMDFWATVQELKYKDTDTRISVRIPDDVIEAINRQKTRLNLYKVKLVPILGTEE
jgi:predicted DNA binding CopG/RHH family protein